MLAWSAGPVRGQVARLMLEQGHRAYDVADFEGAARLLPAGLNPNAGPRDSLWISGVHKLAYVLIHELGQSQAAGAWLRWAVRQMPDLQADTVNFTTAVVAAIGEARAFVRDHPLGPGAQVRWQWPPGSALAELGALLFEGANVPAAARLESGEVLATGVPRQLPPASYTILATAEGYLPARTTVEVLPGVTTVLRFNLEPAAAGFLYVASRPWGIVSVNGERIGYTPVAAHRLPTGTHRLRIERPGYLPFDTTLAISQPDQRLRLGTIRLQPERPR